jgi:hypothetical protein
MLAPPAAALASGTMSIGDHWMSTLWGCAFEDLVLTGRAKRNVADGYFEAPRLKRERGDSRLHRGAAALQHELYEVSDIALPRCAPDHRQEAHATYGKGRRPHRSRRSISSAEHASSPVGASAMHEDPQIQVFIGRITPACLAAMLAGPPEAFLPSFKSAYASAQPEPAALPRWPRARLVSTCLGMAKRN